MQTKLTVLVPHGQLNDSARLEPSLSMLPEMLHSHFGLL